MTFHDWLTTGLAMLAILALLPLAKIAGRHLRHPVARGDGPDLRVMRTLALDNRRRLSLISCDGRQALVLTGGGQDILLPWGDRS